VHWVNRSVAIILTLVSVLVVIFPPPALPLRYLPVAAVLVLAAMLIWQQGRTAPIPASHVDEMRGVAERLISNLDSLTKPRFDNDSQRDGMFRAAFRDHFPASYRHLERFETLLIEDGQAWSKLTTKIASEAGAVESAWSLNYEHVRAVLTKTAEAQMSDSASGVKDPGPFSMNVIPPNQTVLFLGGSGIAVSTSPTAQQDLAKSQQAFIDATRSVPTWPETHDARSARLALLKERDDTRRQLVEIAHRHGLPRRCRLCAAT